MTNFAITNARVFDGSEFHTGKAVIIRNGKVDAIINSRNIPSDIAGIDAQNQILAPGLIDVQVNGGGGVIPTSSVRWKTTRLNC